jgi:hypothetical protein
MKEIVIATNPNVEGDATALYLARLLKPLGIRVTRIAHGVPVGGDLDYADQATLIQAYEAARACEMPTRKMRNDEHPLLTQHRRLRYSPASVVPRFARKRGPGTRRGSIEADRLSNLLRAPQTSTRTRLSWAARRIYAACLATRPVTTRRATTKPTVRNTVRPKSSLLKEETGESTEDVFLFSLLRRNWQRQERARPHLRDREASLRFSSMTTRLADEKVLCLR